VLQDYESTIAEIDVPLPSIIQIPKQSLTSKKYFLPFSAKKKEALLDLIRSTRAWILPPSSSEDDGPGNLSTITLEPGAGLGVTIEQLSYLLATTREHFPVRKAFVVRNLQEFLELSVPESEADGIDRTVDRRLVNAAHAFTESSGNFDVSVHGSADALALAYGEVKVNASFSNVYHDAGIIVPSSLLRSFPLYPFQREYHWKTPINHGTQLTSKSSETIPETIFDTPTLDAVSSLIVKTLRLPEDLVLTPETNILDLGMNSLNSIELALLLTKTFGRQVDANRLYQLTLLKEIISLLMEEYPKSERTDSIRQAELDALVQKFCHDPLEVYDSSQSTSNSKPELEDAARTVLLTGATGFLGVRTLNHLLRFLPTSTRIACLVRGDAATRLISSFDKCGLSTNTLSQAIASGKVLPIAISDISEPYLGTSESVYEYLLSSVHIIIHLAWTVDFNKTPLSFESDIQGTRNLAQLAAKSRHRTALFFATSFSSTFGYKGAQYVPEKPLDPDVTYSLDQVCILSIHVADITDCTA
jgi:acyl carrier protein